MLLQYHAAELRKFAFVKLSFQNTTAITVAS